MTRVGQHRTALDLPLGPAGATLIEASAGTGKTYTLTTLVARLVVERKREIGDLLVVTFTNAATDELRDKIRHTLRAALRLAAGDSRRADAQAAELLAHWGGLGIPREEVVRRLDVAVSDLDRANVLTIHGFCQRVLTDFAFECALPFGFEVTGEGFDVVQAVVRDHWRRRLYPAPSVRVRFALARKFLDEELVDWVAGNVGRRGLAIRGAGRLDEPARAEVEQAERTWEEALRSAGAALDEARAGVRDERGEAAVLAFDQALDRAESALVAGGAVFEPEVVAPALADHPILGGRLGPLEEAAAALRAVYERWLPRARRDALESARESIDRRVRDDGMLGYDDLLTVVQRSLARSAELAARVRERFPFALIDEYQDTDRMQADIFRRIYGAGAGGVFIVGDPKQSIYRFRSADVFAYLGASASMGSEERLHLARNYRSVRGLVDGVNALFDRPLPFVLPEVGFEPVASAYGARAPRLVVEGEDDPAPLQFRVFRGQDGRQLPKREASPQAARQVAAEIAELLGAAADGRARIGRRPVRGGDVAVLVRKTEQGRSVAEELRGYGVRSVEIGDADVFESREADQLERLLWAVAKPQSPDRVRGALAGDLFGLDARALARLVDDDEAWNTWKEGLESWRGLWESRGVATMIRRLLWDLGGNEGRSMGGATRLLTHPDGARRLTNVMHLADLLQRAEAGDRLTPTGVAAWFSRRRANVRRADEVAQLRLESDEDLVKIVSIHRSKGLEFPIVFCPYAWDARAPRYNRGATALYHERERAGYPEVLHLAPEQAEWDREWVEDVADETRLLYVALTRARLRCVVTWGPATFCEHAPLAWLLRDRDGPAESDVDAGLKRAARDGRKRSARDWFQALAGVAATRPGSIGVTWASERTVPPLASSARELSLLRARAPERRTRRVRQMTSYSALVHGAGAAESPPDHEEVELPDHDGDAEVPADETDRAAPARLERTPFTFPSGARAGNSLHRILERLDDAAEPHPDLDGLCRESLAAFGFGTEWAGVARTMVENARRVRLAASAGPGSGSGGGFRLGELQRPIPEMEFHFPVRGLDRRRLGAILAEHGYENPFTGAGARPVDGFLRGFVDLVAAHEGCWYVVDYKSNQLGPSPDRYAGARLDEAMRHNGYQLQYLVYLVALHRYLALRVPDYDYERHVGGAFYLFLRGVDPEAGMARGIHFDRPSAACMAALDACFAGEPSRAEESGG